MSTARDRSAGVSLSTEEARLVRDSAERLQCEFAGTFNTETIERFIHDSQNQLTSQATISMWLPVLIERVTRRVPDHSRQAVSRLGHPESDRATR